MSHPSGLPTQGQQRLRQHVYHFLHHTPNFATQDTVRQERTARDFFAELASLVSVQADPLLSTRYDAGIAETYLQWVRRHQDYVQQLPAGTYTLPVDRFVFLPDLPTRTTPRYGGGTHPHLTLTYLLQLARGQFPLCEEATWYPQQQLLTADGPSRHCLLAYTLWGETQVAVRTLKSCASRMELPTLLFGKTLLEIQDALTTLALEGQKTQFRFRLWDAAERHAVQSFGRYPPAERQAHLTAFIAQIARQPLKWFDIEMLLDHIEEQHHWRAWQLRYPHWLHTFKQWWTSTLLR